MAKLAIWLCSGDCGLGGMGRRYVQSAGEPVSQAEAAEAIGLSSVTGSLPKVVKEARAQGWLAPAYGRGTAGVIGPGRFERQRPPRVYVCGRKPFPGGLATLGSLHGSRP